MKRREAMKFLTCHGTRVHVRYEPRFDGTSIVLEEIGREDLQEKINSFGRFTDLHYMLHRLSVGDQSVLSSHVPVYGDFSGLPSSPVDVINIIHGAESRFGQLSMEERSLYNNDFRAWLAAVLSGSYASPGSDSVPDSVDSDVKVEEVFVNEP